MKKTIWFDMDGTLADTYSVENWLAKLRKSDPSPYAEAKVMHNMSLLARYLNKLQSIGYHIGVITWLAMDSTTEYDEAVTSVKMEWLNEHLQSVHFNSINVVQYGTPKTNFMETNNDILFDDNNGIREAWTGEAYEPNEILSVLKKLLREE